jgi:hypothetical protein
MRGRSVPASATKPLLARQLLRRDRARVLPISAFFLTLLIHIDHPCFFHTPVVTSGYHDTDTHTHTHTSCTSKNFAPPHHHVFTSSRDRRPDQERTHSLSLLLRMVSCADVMPAKLLTQTAPTFCFPAKTSLRINSCSRAAHVPSPKKRPRPASCATTSPRRLELRLV